MSRNGLQLNTSYLMVHNSAEGAGRKLSVVTIKSQDRKKRPQLQHHRNTYVIQYFIYVG